MALLLALFAGAMVLISRNLHRSTVDILIVQNEAYRKVRAREAELAHLSRLGTMGEMATSLAHEMNQPLASIINFCSGAQRRLDANADPTADEIRGAFQQISAQAARASEVIRHIKSFSGKNNAPPANAQINGIIQSVTSLVEFGPLHDGITLRLELADQLPDVRVRAVEIEQVILNLVRNGVEALSATTEPELVIQSRPHGQAAVEVDVRDNGGGVADEILDKVFEPYFTTKPDGMGMGLAISRTIIEAHGGHMWVTSEPAHGTTFGFTLPLASVADDR